MSYTFVPTSTVTHRLVGWGHDPVSLGVPQRVFGELVLLATPVLKEYHSDLFWDAISLKDKLTKPIDFYFIVRPSGTHLYDNLTESMTQALLSLAATSRGAIVYFVSIQDDNGTWIMAVTEGSVKES